MKYLYINKNWELNKEYNIDKILYLMVDRPNQANDYDFIFVWRNNKNQFHRNYDLPTDVYIYKNNTCSLCWDTDNKLHRENNKPAVIKSDGKKSYYINGKFIKKN